MLNIEIKKLPGSEIEITGEISAGDFEICREQAVKELAGDVKIDGFRPGRVPEKILIEKIGQQIILERMAEICLQKQYQKILEENKIKAIGRPRVEITKIAANNPLGFKIKTSVMPEIELSNYKEIIDKAAKEFDSGDIAVEDNEIEQMLDHLRKTRAEKNDKGEEILPEINDDFAKKLGKFESMDDLRRVLRRNLTKEKEMKNQEKKRINVLTKIIESSEIEAPGVLVESEKEKMLEEMKANIAQAGLKWEDYLSHLKIKEDDLKKDWEKDATKKVKFGLVLDKIAEMENVEVPEDELKKESEKIIEYYKKFGQNIDENRVKEYTYGIIRNEKVFKLLLC